MICFCEILFSLWVCSSGLGWGGLLLAGRALGWSTDLELTGLALPELGLAGFGLVGFELAGTAMGWQEVGSTMQCLDQ